MSPFCAFILPNILALILTPAAHQVNARSRSFILNHVTESLMTDVVELEISLTPITSRLAECFINNSKTALKVGGYCLRITGSPYVG